MNHPAAVCFRKTLGDPRCDRIHFRLRVSGSDSLFQLANRFQVATAWQLRHVNTIEVNRRKVVDELSQTGFEGWTVVEQDVDTTIPNVRPLESARRSRQYLRNVIKI